MVDNHALNKQQVALAAAQQRIAELEAENTRLKKQVGGCTAVAQVSIGAGDEHSSTKNANECFTKEEFILGESVFRQLAENMHDGLTIIKDQQIVYMSRQLSTITGYTYDELKHKSNLDLAAPEEKTRLQEAIAEQQQTPTSIGLANLKYWIIRKDGARCYIQTRYWASPDNPNIFYILTTDITERRLFEEALFQSESLYRSIFEGVGDAILVEGLDGSIIDVNAQACTLYGYTYREMLRLNAADLVPPKELPTLEAIRKGDNPPTSIGGERLNIRANGEVFPVEISAHVHDIGLEPAVLIVVRDITERKAVEAALRESERKFSRAFQTTAVSMSIYNLANDSYLEVNDGFTALTGYTAEEVIGHSATKFNIRTNTTNQIQLFENLAKDGIVTDFEVVYRRKDGSLRTGLLSAHTVEINGQTCVISIMRDITERKAMEAALRQSEDYLAKVFRTIPDAIVITRLADGLLLDVNEGFCTLLGYDSRDEVTGHTTLDIKVWPNQADRQRLLDDLREEGVVQNYEITVQRKDGSQLVGLISSRVFELDDEQCLITIFRDISERIKVETELRQSEERLANVFRTIPDAVTITRLSDGMLLEANDGLTILTGYTIESILGKTTLELNLWVDPKQRSQMVEHLKQDNVIHNMEVAIRHKNGSQTTGLLSAQVIGYKGEKCLLMVTRDISERIKVKRALQHSEDYLAKVFRTIPDAIVITSVPDGLIFEVNQGFLSHLRYTAEEVIGKTTMEINLWVNLADRQYFLEQLQAHGVLMNFETPFRRNDGTIVTGLVSARLFELNEKRRLIVVVRDITDRKEAEAAIHRLNEELETRVQQRTEELEEANRYLRQLTQVKDEFVSNVSHELRTPITNLKLHQYLLAAQPEKAEHHLSVLQRETERLAGIIEDLLHLSRLDQGAVKMQVASVDLNTLIEKLIQDRQRMAEEKQLSLCWEVYPAPVMVLIDAGLIEQVVSILVTNALHYTPKGGQIMVLTTIRHTEEQRWAGFRVWDTGLGIQPEDKEHLFDRFYRGSAGQQSKQPGTGLGLALADRIIQQHNGTIEVASSGIPGEGSSFTVWLPMEPAH